jgi:hypothetical protein
MATKYFLYSDEQIKEKNAILARTGKEFVPGIVTKNGKRIKYTQLSDSPDINRFADTKIIASGELSSFTYTKPSSRIMKG